MATFVAYILIKLYTKKGSKGKNKKKKKCGVVNQPYDPSPCHVKNKQLLYHQKLWIISKSQGAVSPLPRTSTLTPETRFKYR